MKRSSHRIERVNGTIKEILSELLLTQIKDPRVGMVTITSVRVSSDLSTAKVYYTVMGDDDRRAETERGLNSAKNFMRRVVADELKLRSAPELKFEYDDSLDRAMRIEEALKEGSHQPQNGDSQRGDNHEAEGDSEDES